MLILPLGHEANMVRRLPWITLAILLANVVVFLTATEQDITAYAYRPGGPLLPGLLTYQFLHGGWLHLAGNLWFLWLVAANMEDTWGRILFPVFYLIAGVVAALAHQAVARGSTLPLVGASGAIAGAMGAFLVRFGTVRIRFLAFYPELFFLSVYRRFKMYSTFRAPAYIMLPLWLVSEVASLHVDRALSMPSHVAYGAHIGGFLFGVVAGLAVRASGLEKKIEEKIEQQGAAVQDRRIARAHELLDAGRPREAIPLLEKVALEQPDLVDAPLALLRAARDAGDRALEKRAYLRLVTHYLRNGEPAVVDLYDEMAARGMAADIPPALRFKLAGYLDVAGHSARAAVEYERLHGLDGAPGVQGSLVDDETRRSALLAHAALLMPLRRKREILRLLRAAEAIGGGGRAAEKAIQHGLRVAESMPGPS